MTFTALVRFQFHEGPIKTQRVFFVCLRKDCFNSMKVRLKPAGINPYNAFASFQFHEGPIKTYLTYEQKQNGA